MALYNDEDAEEVYRLLESSPCSQVALKSIKYRLDIGDIDFHVLFIRDVIDIGAINYYAARYGTKTVNRICEDIANAAHSLLSLMGAPKAIADEVGVFRESVDRLDRLMEGLDGSTLLEIAVAARDASSDIGVSVLATQQFVRLRPLGGSGMLNVPTHSLIVATGNNLSIVGDLKRRVVMIRLDAKTERPEHRSFDHDHLVTVAERRGEIITLALTIVAAYLAAGAPKIPGRHGFGGFEQWDRMVRRPLLWLDLPDPLLTSEELREQDPDLEAMRLMLTAWLQSFGERSVTVAEVINESQSVGQSENEELRDALQLVCAEKPNSRRLGFWLRAHRERIIDGLQLRQAGADGHAKVAKWKVIKCG